MEKVHLEHALGGNHSWGILGYCYLRWWVRGIVGSPMAGLLRHDVLPFQPQRGFFSSPPTLEMSTKPLPVSMVTHWELRFLKVARQMIQEGAGVSGKLERKSDGLCCQSNITSELFAEM